MFSIAAGSRENLSSSCGDTYKSLPRKQSRLGGGWAAFITVKEVAISNPAGGGDAIT